MLSVIELTFWVAKYFLGSQQMQFALKIFDKYGRQSLSIEKSLTRN